jgi:hypothetical protein
VPARKSQVPTSLEQRLRRIRASSRSGGGGPGQPDSTGCDSMAYSGRTTDAAHVGGPSRRIGRCKPETRLVSRPKGPTVYSSMVGLT